MQCLVKLFDGRAGIYHLRRGDGGHGRGGNDNDSRGADGGAGYGAYLPRFRLEGLEDLVDLELRLLLLVALLAITAPESGPARVIDVMF